MDWSNFEKVELSDEWYDVYKLPGSVYAIFEPGQVEYVISFLILGDESALLWDTGTGISDIRKAAEELTDLPIRVLNSHCHFDHIGGNHLFDSGNIYYYNSDFSRGALTDGVPHDLIKGEVEKDSLTRELPKGFEPGGYSIIGKPPGIPVSDGDIIDVGGRSLEVWHTPGHSPDGIMLYDKSNAILFTGDIYYPDVLFCLIPDCDIGVYAKTLRKLADEIVSYNVEWLYCSHTGIVKDLTQLAHAAQAMESLADGTKTDYEPARIEFAEGPMRSYKFEETGIEILLGKWKKAI